MKASLFFFLMVVSIITVAQPSERERVYILSNYMADIGVCSNCDKEEYLRGVESVLNYQEIDVSPRYNLMRKAVGREKAVADSIQYSIQFYRIRGNNWIGNLYLAHLVDEFSRNINIWLRLAGWRENDMRFLYLMYKKNGMKERDFKRMVLSWSSIDTIVFEAQIDKILDGAISNKMEDDCFISEYYKLLDGLRVRDMGPTDNRSLYSVFSRQPMAGMWLEF